VCAYVGAAILLAVTLGGAAAEPKRVLLLHSFGRDFAPWNVYAKYIRAELDRQSSEPLDIHEASLTTARFADENPEGPFADYLRATFSDHRLDLVISIGAPAASFFQRHRRQLFPSTPMLLTAVEQRRVAAAGLTANDAVVAISINFAGVVENILRVLPETTNVAVVIGNSPLEKYWLEQLRGALQPFTTRVMFTWFNELPFDDMIKRAATLPPRSAIFFALLSVDAAGIPYEEDKALASLHAIANAPIFSYVDAYFGGGIVGGPLISVQDVGRQATRAATRVLGGEAAGDIKIPPIESGTPRFDWWEMRRWNISEASLPAGSVVEFHEQTAFEQYKWYIIAAVAFCGTQAILIVVLLLNRRRLRRATAERQKAEEAAHELSGRLINAQEDERSRLARELHDDVTQRLALLAIEAGRGERALSKAAGGAAMQTMRENLVRLSEDVHALSYRLHPSILEDLGLTEALKSECKRFSDFGSTQVEVDVQEAPREIPRDVALCLFRITQEALRNVARHALASHARVTLRRLNGAIEVVVKDDGVGFNPTQTHGRSHLGHASMRQRIHLLGGKLHIDGVPGHGTTVLAWIPLKEMAREPSAHPAG